MKAIQKLRDKVTTTTFKSVAELKTAFEDLKEKAEERRDELQEKYDELTNQDGPKGEAYQEKIDALDNFITQMEDIELEDDLPDHDDEEAIEEWIADRKSELENIDL